jgi:hypothetical protein
MLERAVYETAIVRDTPMFRVKLYSSKTSALEGGEWSATHPGHSLPPGKTRYPLYRRLGGPQGRSGQAENLASIGTELGTELKYYRPDRPEDQ